MQTFSRIMMEKRTCITKKLQIGNWKVGPNTTVIYELKIIKGTKRE